MLVDQNQIESCPPLFSVDDIEQFLLNDDDDGVPYNNEDDGPPKSSPSGGVVDLSSSDEDNQKNEPTVVVDRKDDAAEEEVTDPLAKKRKRQLRNKDAALRSRQRKKMYVKDLEMKSRYYEAECKRLGSLLQCFIAENQALRFSMHTANSTFNAAPITKQESAVLFLESLLLGSLLWLISIVCQLVVLPRQPHQQSQPLVVEEKHLPNLLVLSKGASKLTLMVGKPFKASRSRMRLNLTSLQDLLLYPESDDSAQLSQIETEKLLAELVEAEMNKRQKEGSYKGKKFNAICHFFGYQARGSLPSKFDCDYAYVLGHICYHILAAGLNGYMATVTNLKNPSNKWRCGAAPVTAMLSIKHGGHGSRSMTIGKPFVHPATVDLRGKVYGLLRENARKLLLDDIYRNPGPLQFDGPGADSRVMSLCVEDLDYMGHIKKLNEYLEKVQTIVKPGCSQDVLKAALSAMSSVSDILSIMSKPSNGNT